MQAALKVKTYTNTDPSKDFEHLFVDRSHLQVQTPFENQ
jgi:hypothetical protein